mmetsp:Transcript_14475/g.35439  ORF Transcript_14475/g.35439 Transcript_14475/m.35439 type:complete len:269 (-) Transcript_14475:31-837(-)
MNSGGSSSSGISRLMTRCFSIAGRMCSSYRRRPASNAVICTEGSRVAASLHARMIVFVATRMNFRLLSLCLRLMRSFCISSEYLTISMSLQAVCRCPPLKFFCLKHELRTDSFAFMLGMNPITIMSSISTSARVASPNSSAIVIRRSCVSGSSFLRDFSSCSMRMISTAPSRSLFSARASIAVRRKVGLGPRPCACISPITRMIFLMLWSAGMEGSLLVLGLMISAKDTSSILKKKSASGRSPRTVMTSMMRMQSSRDTPAFLASAIL